ATGLMAAFPRPASFGCPSSAGWTSLALTGRFGAISIWLVAVGVAAIGTSIGVLIGAIVERASMEATWWETSLLVLGGLSAAVGGAVLGEWWLTPSGYAFVDMACWVSSGTAHMGGGMSWINAAGQTFLSKPEPLVGTVVGAVWGFLLLAALWSVLVLATPWSRRPMETPA